MITSYSTNLEENSYQSLWDENEEIRNNAKSINCYVSECIENNNNTASIMADRDLFLAAFCKLTGEHFLCVRLFHKHHQYLRDVDKIYQLFSTHFLSGNDFKLYVVHDDSNKRVYLKSHQGIMLKITKNDEGDAIYNYEAYSEVLKKISKIFWSVKELTEEVRVSRYAHKPEKELLNAFEFSRIANKDLPAINNFPGDELSNLETLIDEGFFLKVMAMNNKTLTVHVQLLPYETILDSHDRVVNFKEYSRQSLAIFFESFCMTEEEFYEKYNGTTLPCQELLELAGQFDHPVLRNNCRKIAGYKIVLTKEKESAVSVAPTMQDNIAEVIREKPGRKYYAVK